MFPARKGGRRAGPCSPSDATGTCLFCPTFFHNFPPSCKINAVAQGHESSVHGGTIQRLEKDDSSRYVESYRGRGLQLIIIFTI